MNKLIDENLVYDTLVMYIKFQWDKWRNIIYEYKKMESVDSDYLDGFEFLAGEINRIRKMGGVMLDRPHDNLSRAVIRLWS